MMDEMQKVVAKSSRNYFLSLILVFVFFLGVGCLGVLVGRIHSFVGVVIAAILLECVLVSLKYTDKVEISNGKFQIFYYKWFIKRKLEFDVNNITIHREEKLGNRGYKYSEINIMDKGKLVYQITLKGFLGELEDFYLIERYFNSHNI